MNTDNENSIDKSKDSRQTDQRPDKLPLFTSQVRVLIMAQILIAVIVLLSIFNYNNLRSKSNIQNVDSLSGQRIGCCTGWESDYLLSDRDDITLLRYESNADCVMALSYGQIDAVALDEITMHTILLKTEGMDQLADPITQIGCTFYASYKAEEKMEEFNTFAKEFYESDEYQAYHDNVFTDDYQMADIPEIRDGKKLIVGYVPDSYPESYLDFTTGKPAGYGVEMLKRFAYAYGYTIEWVETSDTAALIQLSLNQMDFAACYVSDVYREDTEQGGQAHMTAPYFYAEVYLMKVKEGEKLKITSEIDD